MSSLRLPLIAALVGGLSFSSLEVKAAEYGFSTYLLGQSAFGAGITPPPGTYVSAITSLYTGDIGRALPFGNGQTVGVGAHAEYRANVLNVLYVFSHKVLGGSLGVSATLPTGFVSLDANVTAGGLSAQRSTDGGGFGDVVGKLQLGWQNNNFSHTAYIQAVAPTGRYEPGFNPIVGLHRPGVDTGWAFSWTEKATSIQFNGALGVTFNFENSETNYKSGDELHLEWSVGRALGPGLMVGIMGYDYRQVTADSGSGATLGALKGRVDAIGLGASGTTLLGTMPLIMNIRVYKEFNVENRWEGYSSIASATIKF